MRSETGYLDFNFFIQVPKRKWCLDTQPFVLLVPPPEEKQTPPEGSVGRFMVCGCVWVCRSAGV